MRNNNFTYIKGSAKDFIRAPEWATLRTKFNNGYAWLERREIGARFSVVGHRNLGVLVINRLPKPCEGEIIIARRVAKV